MEKPLPRFNYYGEYRHDKDERRSRYADLKPAQQSPSQHQHQQTPSQQQPQQQ